MPMNKRRHYVEQPAEGPPKKMAHNAPANASQEAKNKKSKQTSLEHKERAFIAASRRSDRDLKARLDSALAASDIHQQRTGKRLRGTEEIVRNEQMYEEEDDMAWHYAHYGQHWQLADGHMEGFPGSLASAAQKREIEIERTFNEAFPGYRSSVRRSLPTNFAPQAAPNIFTSPYAPLQTGPYGAPRVQIPPQAEVPSPQAMQISPVQRQSEPHLMTQMPPQPQVYSPQSLPLRSAQGASATRHSSFDSSVTPALTPGSTESEMSCSNPTPDSTTEFYYGATSSGPIPVDPSLSVAPMPELYSLTPEIMSASPASYPINFDAMEDFSSNDWNPTGALMSDIPRDFVFTCLDTVDATNPSVPSELFGAEPAEDCVNFISFDI